MKMVLSRVLAAAAVLAVPALAEQASPIGKAIQLLGDMQAKIIKEGEGAQKLYSEFAEWCEDRSAKLNHEIKTGKAEVGELKAAIDEEVAKLGSLNAQVEKLAGDISTDEADLKAAQVIRVNEHTAFAADEKELMEVVDTLQRAVGILEREMKGGASMLQLKGANNLVQAMGALVQASMLSTADASRLQSFLQSSSEDEDVGAPAGAVYESQSGNIVQTISDLLEKAEEQLETARSTETKSLQAFEMMEQGLKDEIKFANKELSEAKEGIAAASEKKASSEGDLEMTQKDLSADVAGLSELHHECMTKAEDFEAETKSRGEELGALAAAKQALAESTAGADALSYGLDQVSFLQTASRAGARQYDAARLVRKLAEKTGSKGLALLAQRISNVIRAGSKSGDDVFAKVKGLIQDMLEKLEAEAEADATKKAYCDKELSESTAKKAEKTAEIEKLSTQIDKSASRSAQLKEEVSQLQNELSALASAQASMDQIRSQEHEAFVKNKADLDQGLEGIKTALKVLNEYYASKDKAHTAASGASSGIIGLLEVVESDFAKSLAEIASAEETAAADHERETKENDVERVAKEKDVEYKGKESASLDKTVSEVTSDRSGVQAELDAVAEYLSKIEEQCIAKAESYADRTARRQSEIAGLKEALQVLESETAFVQRRASHHKGALRGHVLSATV